ncbi:MAG TPA: formate dehydrogenase accessory sulfurtransferase FdhD [Thermoanaerobaculia bacterium]|nr:formate dehydrogenase accessory sulfurtransferase FdhD [Thermoanaerobaculia bacterium]
MREVAPRPEDPTSGHPGDEPAGARAVRVQRLARGAAADLDWVAVEEPLEIRVERRPFAITLRTPGHDRELALGFLLAEGVIDSLADVGSLGVEAAPPDAVARGERVEVTLGEPALDRWARRKVERELRVTSACGACGKPTLEDLWGGVGGKVAPIDLDPAMVPSLLHEMQVRQILFQRTGGIHAAAAFDPTGRCLGVFEDIGRHNAVDKLVGSLADRPQPLAGSILVVSGRAGFEIVQKAAMAGAPVLVAVGAASSLAVELAVEAGMELLCFAGSPGAHRHLGPA